MNDRSAARAIDAMRRGWPIAIGEGDAVLRLLAIETADAAQLAAFDPEGRADVLLSAARAETLKLANQREAADPGHAVRIERAPWLDFDTATALSDPALDLATPLKGPFRATAVGDQALADCALDFARMAGLLPAFFVLEGGPDPVSPADIRAFSDPARLQLSTRARLPVQANEGAEIVAFRGADGGDMHVALILGAPNGQPPVVRLHSECLTGDVLGSLKCDCGPQLQGALKEIAGAGWGILLYLRQEGRGIGLINKLRAYRLQDQGFDTVDANTRLGFRVDARDFRVAARMLELLGQSKVRLLTNNPAKVAELERAGIEVVERVPHRMTANPFNEKYLATKRDRTGHQL
ncbi:GTP cyclohydrolase II [Sphingomonas sp.]|uniref:GTP cyclohydrolase II n=1 Tax=Sphingomonas sp. TaxID=28214 RepID=UPI002DEED3C3|nr:GTP cyclohydrolase II [Sphingomonas sp.]